MSGSEGLGGSADHRDPVRRPTESAILTFSSPSRAERFCHEAGWDFESPRLIYPVHVHELHQLNLDHVCVISDGVGRYNRFPGTTELVRKRLQHLVDHLQVPFVSAEEVLEGEES